MTLGLGACTYTYVFDHSWEATLERLAALGFKWLEVMTAPPHIWPRDLDPKARETLRRQIESYGMHVISSQPAWLELNLVAFNPGIRAEVVKQMKENIELLHDLGGKVLDIFPGRREGLVAPSMETAWALAKEIFSACVEDAERYGVTLAIETVPRGFIETGAQAAQMAEEIGSPAIGVCVDIANVNAVQSPIAALEEAKERLALVHLSDNYGEHIHAPIGEGNVDFAAVASKLREIEYDGVSLLEVMTRDKVDEAFGQSKLRLEELGWQS